MSCKEVINTESTHVVSFPAWLDTRKQWETKDSLHTDLSEFIKEGWLL